MSKVPAEEFDYRKFAPPDRLPAFRQLSSALYETWAEGKPEDFQAELYGHQVGDMVFNKCTFSPARFLHSDAHISGDGKDFLSLQAQLAGDELLLMDCGIFRLLPDNIYLRDWAHPFDSRATAMQMYTIVVPRERLAASKLFSEDAPVLSWCASQPEGRMLFKLWSELISQLNTVSPAQAEILCEAFLNFIDGLLGHGNRQDATPSLPAMEQYLQARLRAEVGVAELCRQFGVSRSTVFRLFEPHGGVNAYLGRLRIERVYADLHNADPQRVHVGEIAASWRFYEPSSFSRKFRRHFGVLPSEVLGAGLIHRELIKGASIRGTESFANYATWLRNASRPLAE